MAATIMVIRHGEKPLGDGPPHGVDGDGNQDRESLTPRGWQRAGAIVGLFARDPAALVAPAPLPTPTRLLAALARPGGGSHRPRQTLDPLAERLGIAVDTRFAKTQIGELAEAAVAAEGPVLIAWEHHLIPSLVTTILGRTDGIPTLWPDDRYDVTWILEPASENGRYTFRQSPQLLLAGDRDEPIGT